MNTETHIPTNPSRQVTLEEVKKMSDEELRETMAELAGWERFATLAGNGRTKKWRKDGLNYYRCPNFVFDLNAVHEVVKGLQPEQYHAYAVTLANFFWPNGWSDWRDTIAVSEATARQRCEALVLCLSQKENV